MSDLIVGIVSAITAGFVAWWGVERQLRVRNVTEERAKWRDRIRALAMDLAAGPDDREMPASPSGTGGRHAVRRRAATALRLSLNPYDSFDREIVALLAALQQPTEPDPEDVERVLIRLQLLLKHDWERAKQETLWTASLPGLGIFGSSRARRPARPDYVRCKEWRSRNPIDPDRTLPAS